MRSSGPRGEVSTFSDTFSARGRLTRLRHQIERGNTLNSNPEEYVSSLREAKQNFLSALKACDEVSHLHGNHIIESYLNKYLDPDRGSAESLRKRTNQTIAEIKNFRLAQISITSEIAFLVMNLELAISDVGLKALEQTLREFGRPLVLDVNDPLDFLRQQCQLAENAIVASRQGQQRLKHTVPLLIIPTILTIQAATNVLKLRSSHLAEFSDTNLNKILALKKCVLQQAIEEKDKQVENHVSNFMIDAFSIFFDIAMDELPTGTLLRIYKRLRAIFIGKEIDFSKSDVEKIDLLLDMFEAEHAAFDEFENLLSSTSEYIRET